MKVSIIIPAYNEEDSLPHMKEALDQVMQELATYRFEIIIVDDGSRDATSEIIRDYAQEDAYHYIIFSRNFGKEAAMLAGLSYASGDIVGIMDADLQHSPQMIEPMLGAILNEGYDVAATKRSKRRKNSRTYNTFASFFYKVINRFSDQVYIEEGSQDFRFMKRKVVQALLAVSERKRFSKGLFAWLAFDTKWFEVEDQERVAGKSKWNYLSSFRYALDGILSFSIIPLRISFFIGSIIALIGIVYALVVIFKTLMYGGDVPGYPSLMSGILIIGGLILLSLGVIGEYVARIYEEVKQRPHFLVKEKSEELKIKE